MQVWIEPRDEVDAEGRIVRRFDIVIATGASIVPEPLTFSSRLDASNWAGQWHEIMHRSRPGAEFQPSI